MRIGVTSFLNDRSMTPSALALAAEERGFWSLYFPEHTHLPVRADQPPALVDGVHLSDYRRSLDPIVALTSAAAVTSRIRLGTGVLLVAQHDPIILAKQLATLDHLSGGRVRLGVGFGWNRHEVEDHGVHFADRRAIAREHVRCMQALWGDDPAEFHGEHISLDPCWSAPKPTQSRIPTLVGGGPHPGVFAAVADYADGWMPIGGGGVASALPRLRGALERAGRDPGRLEVVPFGTVPSDAKLERLASLGIDEVVLRLPSGDPSTMRGDLDRLTAYRDRHGATRS